MLKSYHLNKKNKKMDIFSFFSLVKKWIFALSDCYLNLTRPVSCFFLFLYFLFQSLKVERKKLLINDFNFNVSIKTSKFVSKDIKDFFTSNNALIRMLFVFMISIMHESCKTWKDMSTAVSEHGVFLHDKMAQMMFVAELDLLYKVKDWELDLLSGTILVYRLKLIICVYTRIWNKMLVENWYQVSW